MILEDYQILNELLEEFRQEETEVDRQLEYYNRCIKKVDIVLKEIKDAEPEDYKVFSPRKMEVLHKEEIEQAYMEKSVYEENNRELFRKKDLLGRRIYKLEKVLERQSNEILLSEEDAEKAEKSEREKQDIYEEQLAGLLLKIEKICQYLDQNQVIQAKQELRIAQKEVKGMIRG